MINIMNWFLGKMRLVDWDEESEDAQKEQDTEVIGKSWLEQAYWKEEKIPEENRRVYFKNIQTYADCKLLIDNCKLGNVCVCRFNSGKNSEAQDMMNYICGGIYALEGEVKDIGDNVFIII